MWWREPVTSLKGIGIKKALEFQKLNIETVGDLLNRFPRMDSYLDYSKVKQALILQVFMCVQLQMTMMTGEMS